MLSLSLDIRSVLVVLTAVTAVLSVTMALVWRTRRTYPGFGYWTGGEACEALGFLMLSLYGVVPAILSVVLVNLFHLAGAALLLEGVRFFRGAGSRKAFSVPLIVLHLLAISYFTYVNDHVAVRLILFSTLMAVFFGLGAWDLLRYTPPDLRFSFRLAGGLFAVQGLVMLARALMIVVNPNIGSLFAPDLVQTVVFIWAMLVSIALTFGFLMLNSERLEVDLKKAQVELERLATTDFLTGIANNRSFFETGEREIQRARRYGRPLAVLMLDLDHFKRVNDTHGHAVGDRVLVAVTATCKRFLRDIDLFGRLGGEEFGMLLPETDLDGGRATAERLRQTVAETNIDAGKTTLCITISIGVSVLSPEDDRLESALKRADDALYEAKRSGRNRIVTALPFSRDAFRAG